jgi:hypothetical protein
VRAQIFNGDGTAAFPRFTLANNGQKDDKNPSVAANSRNGEFLVGYDVGVGGGMNTRAIIVNSSGTTVVPSFPISIAAGVPDWRIHAAYNAMADTYFVTYNKGRSCGPSPCDDVLGKTVAPDGTVGPVIGVANDNFLQNHGLDDGFGSWGDLVSSTKEPKFFDLYQVNSDDINGAIVPFPAVFTPTAISDIEAPSDGSIKALPFDISGYALDPAATTGTGVDLVEIWATLTGGGTPQKLGDVTSFTFHAGVAATYGTQFENSGFSFEVTSGLADGEYDFCAKARSTVTGTFDAEDCVTITVGSAPAMDLEEPTSGVTIGSPYEFSGWAVDLAASSGTGVDKVHIWAFPDDGGPIDWDTGTFMGNAAYGATRTDISGLYGTQFESSGFSLSSTKRLPAGDYIFIAYARSTVTGTFNNSQSVNATADPAIRVEIEAPLSGTRVTTPFDISGWAVDRDNPDNPGLDIVNVWAFPHGIPISFSTGTFLGRTTIGLSRPDVVTLLGNPNWENSGYLLNVTKDLMPGDYRVRVFAKSTTTGTFDGMQEINISVAATGTPDPVMEVEQPTTGATVTTPFVVNGYAADLGAHLGPGVDSVHIWAFPEGQFLNFGAGTFLGSATMGISSSTALALYGAQFEFSGFECNVTKVLPSGNYTISAFARSTITGTYNNRFDVEVTVP